MKKTLLFKQLVLAAVLAVPLAGNGQRLLEDNFNYADGAFTAQNGWEIPNSGNALNVVSTPQLAYANYQEEGIGKSLQLGKSGQDIIKGFTAQTIGSIYAALLVNFSEVQSPFEQSGEYFLHLGESSLSSYFGGRAFAKQSSDGTKMHFGVSKVSTGASAEWTTTEYALNETHLVVVKYTIAAGAGNDEVALFIDPTSTTEPTPDAVSSDNSKDDLVDIGAVGIRQGTSTRTPLGYVGALRVSTTWAGLFNGEGEEPEPSEEPKITLDKTYVMVQEEGEYNVYIGREYPFTLNLKAANLTGDVTVSIKGTSNGQLTTSTPTVSKEDAEVGTDIPFVLKPNTTDWDYAGDSIFISTDGLETLGIPVYWQTYDLIEASNIQTLRSERAKLTEDEAYMTAFVITGEVLVSHAYEDNGDKTIYVQDATGGLKIVGKWGSITTDYAVGDKLANILMMTEDYSGIYGVPTKDFGAPVSSGNEVTPATLTLAELATNAARYNGCLVKVEDVTFEMKTNETGIVTEGKFGDEDLFISIKQGDNSATINELPGADFIGKDVPESARSIIGISTSAAGTAVAPRNLADIDADFDSGEDPGTDPDPDEPGNEVEVGDNLFLDPSFENGRSSILGVSFDDWSVTGGALENTLVTDGETALRITGSGNAKIGQEISALAHTFTTGEAYALTINYYVVKTQGDNDIQMNCTWGGVDVEAYDTAPLTQGFTGAVGTWESKRVRVVVPTGRQMRFQFGLKVPKGAEVIFDNFSFRKLEAITTGIATPTDNGLVARRQRRAKSAREVRSEHR